MIALPSARLISRRRIVLAGAAAWLCVSEAGAAGEDLAGAIRRFTGGTPVRDGRVKFDIAPLVENGNAVPITLTVESPMTADDHVTSIAVFNEKNPQRDVVVFTLGPRAGVAQVATRIRLATSQRLVALARMNDGSCWQASVDVIVTLAACVEG